MKRILPIIFFKSFLALFILFLCNHAFAITYVPNANGADAGAASTWGIDPATAGSGDIFLINRGFILYVYDDITIPNLVIVSSSTLKVNTTKDVTITIIGNLTINDPDSLNNCVIDFGDYNVRFIVGDSLIGNSNSLIVQHPLPGKKQELILNGAINRLAQYITGNDGTSIVRYARNGNQTVFNSTNYSDLYLEGSGTKILAANSSPSLEATVKNKLTLSNCKLQIGNFNFIYSGTESNLTYTNGSINGWIYTNGTGSYSSTSGSTRTFPVGDATRLLAIRLTPVTGTVGVRFEPNASIPNSGIASWHITTSNPTSAKVTLLNRPASSAISSASQIAVYRGSVWKIQQTEYATNNYTTINTLSLSNTVTQVGLYTCPSFNAATLSLPDAITGNTYSQLLDITGGTAYTLSSSSSTHAGYTVSVPAATPHKIKIAGVPPTTRQAATVLFSVKDTTGCQSASFSYIIKTKIQNVWNGTSWSDTATGAGVQVIIAGPYSTAKNGNIKADDIIIQAGATLTLSSTGSIIAADTIKNLGIIFKECGSNMDGNLSGDQAINKNVTISLTNAAIGIAGQPYSQTFGVAGDPDPEFIISNFAPAPTSGYQFTNNTLTFTQATPKALTFTITYTSISGISCPGNQTIQILELPSPNLAILNIGAKTYGDDPFKVRTYSRSSGKITYEIVTSNPCATIDTSGKVTISCGGPSPQNTVTVKATQAATSLYKGETATETFIIRPAAGRFIVRNYAFLLNQPGVITIFTRLDQNPNLNFLQLTGSTTAEVRPDGSVSPLETGTFSVRISLAATNNYTAFDSTYTFTVLTLQKPPVAVSDTITLEMSNDTIVNILDNDLGMTSLIVAGKTDIDMENTGVQSKYYATELGNFLIDTEGNLIVKPFYGFIGSSRIGYTITDANGLTSEVAYVHVTVKPPYVIPELKANEIMSPNNDNLNDALVVANTDLNSENSLVVIDQTGNTVYERTNYQNDWEGFDKNNNKLEAGIYFYIFKEKNTGRQLSKYIQIVTQQ